ncbi:hypothetical protein JZ751_000743, partial [Albula glossodonta]
MRVKGDEEERAKQPEKAPTNLLWKLASFFPDFEFAGIYSQCEVLVQSVMLMASAGNATLHPECEWNLFLVPHHIESPLLKMPD